MLRSATKLAVLILLQLPAPAQLTTAQKLFDFQGLASLYAKRYAPASWKTQALGVNPLDITPWMDRVRQAKTDIDFFEVMMEYTASFQDGHTTYVVPSNFMADLGISVDLYDNKLLVETVNRSRYPQDAFPFGTGDELVSIDGRLAEDLIRDNLRFRREGTERASRRFAADWVVRRPQSVFPRAVELPDLSDVVIRRANGNLESYRMTWLKTGHPLVNVAPTPVPKGTPGAAIAPETSPENLLTEFQNFGFSEYDTSRHTRELFDENQNSVAHLFVAGLAARPPYFDLPQGFVVRRGSAAADNFHSGYYESGGRKIGYIRIPRFSPASPPVAVAEFAAEIQFFQANTDGLVVDVTRNTGGGCISFDYLSYLIPYSFTTFRAELLPTLEEINSAEAGLRAAKQSNAESWIIETYQNLYDVLTNAAATNRTLSAPIPLACGSVTYPAPTETGVPARDSSGNMLAYTKPMILLADEMSASMGDIFAAMFQDNHRGPVVGVRTDGRGGGAAGFYLAGFYSEGLASNTRALVVRKKVSSTPGLPASPYIENIGVEPDIPLDFMTRENLMQRGKPFVDKFTQIILAEIAKAP
ncbi:MAG: S41 family peptidase [Bryobacteraceae bacterium]